MPDTVDDRIPLLAGQNIPTFGLVNPQQRMNMQVLALRIQQAQQNQNAQNMLRSLYSNQDNYDPATGQLKPAALNTLTAAFPQEGMAVRSDMLKGQEEQARASYINSNVYKNYTSDLVNGVTVPSLRAYDDALASGKPPTEAQQIAQRTYTQNLNDWKNSSGAPPSFTQSLAPNFDPVRARNNSLVFKQQQAAEKEQLANEKTQTDIDKAKHDIKLQDFKTNRGAYSPPTQVTVDDGKGNVKSVLAQQDKDSGGWVTADEKHTPLTGVTGEIPKGQEGLYGTPAGNAAASGSTGEDFIKTVPPNEAIVVKKMAQGDIPFPGSFAMRSPYWQHMIQLTAQYDPTFSAATFPTRVAAYKDATSGKTSQIIGSINTAIGHLGNLNKDVDALGNVDFTPYNTLKNFISKNTGKPAVTNFNTDLQAVVSELTRAFRGSGGNEADIERWLQTINSSESPAQLRGAIGRAIGLLDSRLNASTANYQRAIGPLANIGQFIQPKSRRILESLPEGPELLRDYGIQEEKNTNTPQPQGTGNSAPIPPASSQGNTPANPNAIKLPTPVKMKGYPTVYPNVTYEMFQHLKPGDVFTYPGDPLDSAHVRMK